jgi:hypothetical protein
MQSMNAQRWQDIKEQIVSGLRKLRTEGESGSFMIVSAGDVYVQFAGAHGSTQVECQAVGNSYLPAKRQLDASKIAELERFELVHE